MNKGVMVISLGGSIIIPQQVDYSFLNKFRKMIKKHSGKYKFVIVCGGGSIARSYIGLLKSKGASVKEQCLAGIRATRMNALLMMQFFGKGANKHLPANMKEVKDYLKKDRVVFCGALRYAPDETSDGTAATLANYFKSDFVNMTNVKGLYDSDPSKSKKAKFISEISWRDFEKMALEIKYKPGQHFVLDQNAASFIRKNKIKTYIIGKDEKNFDKLLKGENFTGTTISNDI